MMEGLHILIAKGHYIGQIRKYGHRLWETVEGEFTHEEEAMAAAVLKMTSRHKRARVLFIDISGWYEPTIGMECVR